MKKILFILATAALLCAGTAHAQQQEFYRTAYFMEGSTFRSAMNPALRPYRGYINIPVAGNITAGLSSNSLSISNILYPQSSGSLVPFWDKNVTWNMLSSKLQDSNSFDLDFNTSLLGFGFYSGPSFWSFSLDLKVDAGFSLPKEIFRFIKQGSGSYDMSDLSVGASSYLSTSLGYSRRIFQNLTVGGRVNFLGGLARANIHYDKLQLDLNEDVWAVNARGNAEVALNGFDLRNQTDEETGRPTDYLDLNSISDFELSDIRGLAGFGLTFDLGAEYTLMNRITFSASVLDVGYMKWNSGSVVRGISEASYEFEGFEVTTDGSGIGTDVDEYDFDEFTRFKRTPSKDIRSQLRATFVVGAELDIFGNKLLGVGLIYMNKKTEFIRRSEISVAATLRPADWVTAAASYTFRKSHERGTGTNNFGLAINFHSCWINFFVGADYMISKITPKYFIPVSQNKFNVYLGIAVPLGKEKPRTMIKLGI